VDSDLPFDPTQENLGALCRAAREFWGDEDCRSCPEQVPQSVSEAKKEELIVATTGIRYTTLLAVLVLALFGLARVVLGSNIDTTDKWAWSTNAGWINFNPQCLGCEGVTVHSDHLEGYAWGENLGWIRLGTHSGGGSHTYANTTKDNYGVNRDASGGLSGYAWGTNVGWINFHPTQGQATIDQATGAFDGYAWGENIGWIHFKGDTYGVTTGNHVYLPAVLRGA
jgi:hypothetical protein